MITIKNLRKEKPTEPYDVKVDRSSPLGNPYIMNSEKQRKEVCEKYYKWFYHYTHKDNFFHALMQLEHLYKTYGKLNLFCWCAPKQCHAEIIKEFLEHPAYNWIQENNNDTKIRSDNV